MDHIRFVCNRPENIWPIGITGARRVAVRICCCMVLMAIAVITAARAQSDDFASLAASADAARQQGDAPRAIDLYRRVTEKNPNWPDGWWFLGILQYDQNQYQPARDALTRYLQLTPKAAPAFALRGLCAFNLGAYPDALQDLEVAESLGAANQPKNAQILYYHEALLLTHFSRFEEALAKFALLVQQGADSPDLAIAVGLAGLRRNQFPETVQPDQTALLSSVGHAAILLLQKNYDASRQAFQAVFTMQPTTPDIHYLYGYLLFPTNPEKAVDQFHLELAISPRNATAHAMCAWALELQGDYAASLDDARKAAEEAPSLPMAQLVYGKALIETGDLNAGLPHLANVLQAQPGNLEAHLAMTKAYSKLGRSEDARRERLMSLSISQQGAAPVAAP
jgi:tetratricopeptide (TPR) repeat protein